MSLFHQAVRSILKDVEKFLVVTLKNVKLRKDAIDFKSSILSQLNEMKTEFPQLQLTEQVMIEPDEGQFEYQIAEYLDDDDNVSVNPDGSVDGSVVGDSSNIMKVAAKDLTEPDIAGFLKKQRPKALPYSQKRWCVVKGGILYYFGSKTSKKPNGYITLAGYEARPTADTKKKDHAFELVQPGMRTWHFLAGNGEEMEKWTKTINKVSGYAGANKNQSLSSLSDMDLDGTYDQPNVVKPPGEEYEELEAREQLLPDSDDASTGDALETYDDTLLERKAKAAPPSVEATPALYDEGCSGVASEVYDDAEIVQPGTLEDTYDEAQSGPAESDQIYDDGESGLPQGEDIYDDCDIALEQIVNDKSLTDKSAPPPLISIPPRKLRTPPMPRHTPPVPRRTPLEPEPESPPIPPRTVPYIEDIPTVVERRKPKEKEPDYENLYLAKWDCNADTHNELSFKRGDMVHVVDREYDTYSWWVAELNGKRGLVPKNFLMEAYEEVIE